MEELYVIKRDGRRELFDQSKIVTAIEKAMNSSTGRYVEGMAEKIAKLIAYEARKIEVPFTIQDIEREVFYYLCSFGNAPTAKAYEGYRAVHEYKRKQNTSDKNILALVHGSDEELRDENSNKNAHIVSTQRDLIAGEVSKDIAMRTMLPEDVVEAHKNGVIHVHDMDYIIQPMFNCCLIDMQDMLDNGTVVNGCMVESPKSFQVACTVLTQIIAQVASSQYGGQSINGIDRILAPYVRKSYNRNLDLINNSDVDLYYGSDREALAWDMTKREIRDGVQTIQYQINTLMTTNGQAPFVTLFMHFDPDFEYADEAAMIDEEILKQRIKGIKNEAGVYVTPAFPKLIYVLDEHNIHPDSPYFYLTKLAAECTAKRMYPDYISAKKMRETYGDVFSPMGCRSFLSPWVDKDGNLKWDGRFNQGVVSINLPQIAIIAKGNQKVFDELLEKRLELCKKALMCRHNLLLGTTSDVSPIHWQYGAITRLPKGAKIDDYLNSKYSTISLGYIGVYEACLLMTGESNTTPKGEAWSLDLVQKLRDHCDKWKEETGLGFALYGTPAESLCYQFAKIDKETFGSIEGVTDKGWYTNSYHVVPTEHINWDDKFQYESKFQKISSGGCISYVEIPNMTNNVEAVLTMVQFIYDNIQYAEFNTKSDYCHKCGFDGEIKVNADGDWECPKCGNKDRNYLTVVRRTCGYLGSNFWNKGKTAEISQRVEHI